MPVQKITKEEIVRKAIEVFRKQGYNKTSMNDLAIACGLQKGSFYHYFASKEGLMQEVLEALYHYYKNKVFTIAYLEDLSPRARMTQFFLKQEPIFTKDLAGCLFGNITLETVSMMEEFKGTLQAFFKEWLDAFKHLFVQDGCSEEQAEILAEQSVMEIEGALMMMRVFEDVELLKKTCKRVLNRLNN